jgi:hemolysin D
MVIVPDGGDIYVEAQVLNKDISFVREGQPVRVKLEAFPFTDYGLIPATIEHISRDAIERDLPSFQGSSPSKVSQQDSRMSAPSLVYLARIKLHRTTIRIAVKDQQIGPGMAMQAEIKTGERRIIKYLLSPIQKAADEAGREP